MFIYFKVEKETEDSYTMADGTELWLDTEIDRMRNARQYGIVHSVPENIDKYKRFDDGVELTNGDKIYFHHFVVEPDSKFQLFGETVYKLPYEQIFAVEREGKIIPLNQFVFVKPEPKISVSKAIIDINEGDMSENIGKVLYNGSEGEKIGIEEGDRVLFLKKYSMNINGEEVYRVRTPNIVAKVGDEVQVRW